MTLLEVGGEKAIGRAPRFELYYGDCLEIMPQIEAGSIDAIICDPPYGTTACKWDSVIPFAPMWENVKRLIKSRGAVVLFGSEPFSSLLRTSNIDWYKYELIWKKTRGSGFMHAKNKPLKYHENISVFSPGTTVHKDQSSIRMTYNPQMIAGSPYKKFNRVSNVSWGPLGRIRPNWRNMLIENEGCRYPSTIIEMSNPNVGSLHPTQKPVDLMSYLIRTYTNAGDTVLDFTMGSGSTGVAAIQEGRRFVGIEKDAGYFEIAQRRISEAALPLPLLDAALLSEAE